MKHFDLLLYAVHFAFWGSFGLTRLIAQRGGREEAPAAPANEKEAAAPYSRVVLGFHMLAFGVMYFGVGNAVIPGLVPTWFPGQRAVGTGVIALGATLISWALLHFRSWRFRAKLDAGHELATGGPFALVRNPIYLGLDLLALGTALWAPTPLIWVGFVLMAIGGDLRARSEEKLLRQAFGDTYARYSAKTKRFIPGIY